MAISKNTHAQIRGAIAQYCASNDVSKVSAREVYDQLYPEQVDFGTFLQHWEGRDNVKELQAHQAMLDKVNGEVAATNVPAQQADLGPADPTPAPAADAAPPKGRKKANPESVLNVP